VREATVTPHVGAPAIPLDPLTIPERTAELQAALDREGLALRLHAGGEIFPGADLTRAELDAIAHGPPGARWVLAEVPFDGVDVCSLLGRQGDEAQAAARRLVRERLAHVLASDGHPGTSIREHTVAAGTAPAIAAGASGALARRLTYANPRVLLRDGLPGRARPRDRTLHGSLERARQARRRLVRSR
jgi:protein-tyrosine phosphatase